MSVRSRPTPAAATRAVVTIAVAAVLVLAGAGACSLERSGYQFVRSPSTGTYLKVPSEWKVFDQAELADVRQTMGQGDAGMPAFVSIFDGDPEPSLDNSLSNDEPFGFVRVRDLSAAERDVASFASARHDYFDELDAFVEAGQVQVRQASEVEQANASGQRVVFSATADTGEALTVDQTSLVDRGTGRVYLLVVACTATCYERHQDKIDEVVTSLTILEPER